MQCPELLDRGFDMIFLAGRDPPGGDDQIVIRTRGSERIDECSLAIGTNAKITDHTTEAGEQCPEHDAVRVINGAGRQRRPRVAHLVSGRQQSDAQRTKHA